MRTTKITVNGARYEIDRDGVVTLAASGSLVGGMELVFVKRAYAARLNRRAKDAAMRAMGMTKVRGHFGGTYWE